MQIGSGTDLSPAEEADLRHIAGIMIPGDAELGMPGADDPLIFADIVRSLGRDTRAIQLALAALSEPATLSDQVPGSVAALDPAAAEQRVLTFLGRPGPAATALGRAVLQCYYRDDRVLLAVGLEARPPFPLGHKIEQGDWSLLDPVRDRPPLWRDDRRA